MANASIYHNKYIFALGYLQLLLKTRYINLEFTLGT